MLAQNRCAYALWVLVVLKQYKLLRDQVTNCLLEYFCSNFMNSINVREYDLDIHTLTVHT